MHNPGQQYFEMSFLTICACWRESVYMLQFVEIIKVNNVHFLNVFLKLIRNSY